MERIPIPELSQHTAEVLARVEHGETVEITDEGRLVARVVPAGGGELDDLVAAGRVVPATDRTPFQMPAARVEYNAVSEALIAMREEERW
jgi:prevent-host-death family protein